MSIILETPIVHSLTPFNPYDEVNPGVIRFSYEDNQPVKNRAVISDESGEVIYDKEQITMGLLHVIPANTLTAGKRYVVKIQVFDVDGNHSNLSDGVLFYCYTQPTFEFANVHNGDVIKKASLSLAINYSQSEGETLQSIQYMFYSNNKTLLSSSQTFYNNPQATYDIYNLATENVYYVRAVGKTQHGIDLDTGYVEIRVSLELIPANIIFDLNNNRCEGHVNVYVNIKDVGYEFENDDYYFENGHLILNNNSLTYNQNLKIEGDFAIFVEASKLALGTFLETDIFKVDLIDICGELYAKLTVYDTDIQMMDILPTGRVVIGDGNYLVTDTNESITLMDMATTNDSFITFEIKRKNGLYSLKAYYKSQYLE